MEKLPLFLAVFVTSAITGAYAVKNDLHIAVFGKGPVTDFIEKSIVPKEPLIDKNLVGQTAPDFSLPEIGGGTIHLADYKSKLVILNFWASWCSPCRAEIPAFVKVQEKYNVNNVTFLGIAIEDKESVEKFLKEIPINYLTSYGVEESYEVSAKYGNPDGALPYTLVISPDQKIIKSYNGQVSEKMLEEVISQNLPSAAF